MTSAPAALTLASVRVTQYEASPTTTGGYAAPLPERIRAATLSLSTDGVNYTQVWSGELLNQRGAQVIPLTPTTARYARLTINSNWVGGTTIKVSSIDFITN